MHLLSANLNDLFWLDRLIPRAALRIQELEHFLKGIVFAVYRRKVLSRFTLTRSSDLQFVEVMGQG